MLTPGAYTGRASTTLHDDALYVSAVEFFPPPGGQYKFLTRMVEHMDLPFKQATLIEGLQFEI